MIVDDLSLNFLNKFYSSFQENPESINSYYLLNSKIDLQFLDKPLISVRENYHLILPKGNRKIIRCNAIQNQNQIISHASGYICLDDIFYQTNEMFILIYNEEKLLINYQSSYFSIIEEKWNPPIPKPIIKETLPQPPSKPIIKNIIEVQNPNDLIITRSILVSNISFNVLPKEIFPEFEWIGPISRFCQGKGQIAIEFENPVHSIKAIEEGSFLWKKRTIYVKGLPQGYQFP